MATLRPVSHVRFAHLMVLMPLVIAAIVPVTAMAQGVDSDLSQQLSQLQTQVTRLEAALNHQPQAAAPMTQQPTAEGNQATAQVQRIPGVPERMQILAGYQNCIQCHQTRPPGPLPPSHLQSLSVSGKGETQAAGGQESSGGGTGQMAQAGQGMQGMGGGKGLGAEKKMGMGMMGGGMVGKGMGGDKKMGMGEGGMGMMGGGMNKGDSSQASQDMTAMSGGGSTESSSANPAEPQLQQMQQQIQQLQQQMQQMMQIQMQMQLIQMKMMQPN